MASNQTKNKTAKEKIGQTSKKRKAREDKYEKTTSTGFKLLIFFLILTIIGISVGILFSPTFNLNGLVIEDGENVTKADISNVVNVNYGENILKQNYKMLKSNILSLPYISDVKIKLKLPDKIKIEYTEREPYALIKFLDSYYVVDKYGYLLEVSKEMLETDLPIIYGIDVTEYSLGQKLEDVHGTKLKNIVTLLETAKQKKFNYTIYEINYESIGEVKLWVKQEDIEIIYGDIDKNLIGEKLTYLEEMLKRVTGKKGRLDMSDEKYYEKSIFIDISNM